MHRLRHFYTSSQQRAAWTVGYCLFSAGSHAVISDMENESGITFVYRFSQQRAFLF